MIIRTSMNISMTMDIRMNTITNTVMIMNADIFTGVSGISVR